MKKTEIENLIKENIKDTALRIYELDNEDRKSLLAEYRAVSYTHLTLPTTRYV